MVAVQYLSSGYPPQSHGSLAANAEAANVDLEECVPGQNDGGIIVWNKRTKIRAAEIAIRSELWAKLFSSLPDA